MRSLANIVMKTNRNYFLKVSLIVFSLALFHAASGQKKYIKRYKHLADSLSRVYEIPASVILGVAIIESGSGTSKNAKLLNNHFGIVGKNNLLQTKGIKTRYKQYPNIAASYVDFCRIISRRRFYPTIKGKKDYKVWTDAISKSNYSEVPEEWRKKINSAIKKNDLDDLDD